MHQADQPRDRGTDHGDRTRAPIGLERSGEEGSGAGERGHVQRKRSSRGWISTSTSSLPIAAAGQAARAGEGGRGEIAPALGRSALGLGVDGCACGTAGGRALVVLASEKRVDTG
jgi:hypothetical protein